MGILQSLLPPVAVEEAIDSVSREADLFAEKLVTNPSAAIEQLITDAIDFGIKVLAALVVYGIGVWLIRRVKKFMRRTFERRKTDPTIASFSSSFISVFLSLLLIVITVGTLV